MTEPISIPDLAAAIERGLRAKADQDQWGGQYLHCSDLGNALPGGCLRKVWHRINDHEAQPDTVGQLWRFARGNQIHETLTPLMELEDGWEKVGHEIPLRAELLHLFGIERGTTDLLLVNHRLKAFLVVDYKSIKAGGMGRLSAPKEDAAIQAQGYIEAAEFAYQAAYPDYCFIGAVILYADREGETGFKQFFVRRDRAAVEAAAARLRELRDMEQPPPGPAPQGKKQHWKCEYRTRDGEIVSCPYLGVTCPGSLRLAAEAEFEFDLEEALKASLSKGGEGASL